MISQIFALAAVILIVLLCPTIVFFLLIGLGPVELFAIIRRKEFLKYIDQKCIKEGDTVYLESYGSIYRAQVLEISYNKFQLDCYQLNGKKLDNRKTIKYIPRHRIIPEKYLTPAYKVLFTGDKR